jgi:hypothetical protein
MYKSDKIIKQHMYNENTTDTTVRTLTKHRRVFLLLLYILFRLGKIPIHT